MKKLFFMLLAGLGISCSAMAGNMADNNLPNNNTVTIAEAMTLADNTPVMIIATVSENLGNSKYSLTDNSGNMVVEIGDNDWVGVVAQPGNTILIQGTIDAQGNENVEIDVESATVQQPQQ